MTEMVEKPRQNATDQCGENLGELYGRSAAMRTLLLQRYLNTLPMEERAAVVAEFVRRRIAKYGY